MSFKGSIFRANPTWNAQGPPIPGWFRSELRRLNRHYGVQLVLQFTPPSDHCKDGAWNICRRLPHSRHLHPRAVWSLVDWNGNYAPPGMDTVRLLERTLSYHRARRMGALEQEMDRAIRDFNEARCRKSLLEFHQETDRLAAKMLRHGGQWTHKVSLRRMEHASVS